MNDRCVLANVLADQAAKYGSRQALSYVNEKGECLAQYSYDDFNRKTSLCAQGLEALGLQPCTNVLIFTANRPEMLITEFACYANRAVSVSIYSTSSVDQVNYILNDCKPSAIFVGDAKQLDIMRKAMADDFKDVPLIGYDCEGEGVMPWKSLIALGEAASPQCIDAVERRRMAVCPDDTATLIYTSGTTGEPKAAVLTHKNFNTVVRIHRERLTQLSDKDTSLCFLPLSHIFEKGWTYFCIYSGISVAINQNPREIGKTITKVKPSCMCSVPRFWEKAYATINEKLAEMPAWKRWLSRRALACGRKRNLDFVRLGKKVPWLTEAMYKFYDNQFFAPVRRLMGIANGTIYPTAGAPISSTIVEFFRAMGVPMVIGYGLSETTATVTCFPDVGYVIGSVGTVMPELQVRIGPEGEIEVKGDTVMKEYYNKPQATAEAFTKDGWLRTGDAGYFDEEGALVLTERLKDLFKTSNGKYIAPQAIESKLGGDKFIDQVAVVGESRKYVTAIIIPAYEALKEYARKKHIAFKNMEDLIRNSDIVKMIQARIEKLQEGLPSFEQIKKFTLLPHAFTIESGELTNTLKIRRPVIAAHYAKEIDAMY